MYQRVMGNPWAVGWLRWPLVRRPGWGKAAAGTEAPPL